MSTTLAPYAKVLTDHAIEVESGVGGGHAFDGFYCLKLIPWRCSCGHDATHLHAYVDRVPRIIVWPEMDHPHLLDEAQAFKDDGDDPRIVPYERALGPAIRYDDERINP